MQEQEQHSRVVWPLAIPALAGEQRVVSFGGLVAVATGATALRAQLYHLGAQGTVQGRAGCEGLKDRRCMRWGGGVRCCVRCHAALAVGNEAPDARQELQTSAAQLCTLCASCSLGKLVESGW